MVVDDGLNSTVAKICREFLGFGAKIFFFGPKIHTLRISIVEVRWLVGCDLVQLLGIYVTQKNKGTLCRDDVFPMKKTKIKPII